MQEIAVLKDDKMMERIGIADYSDIDEVLELQKKYHIAAIREEDRPAGFVTTLITKVQLTSLIRDESGLFIVRRDGVLVAYAMAASWSFWTQWPIFVHMIEGLHELEFLGRQLNAENSYQYGPVCIDESVRGSGMLARLFDFARAKMAARYPILVTFINKINARSFAAHTQKLGLQVIREFEFNGSQYYELVYETSRSVVPAKTGIQ